MEDAIPQTGGAIPATEDEWVTVDASDAVLAAADASAAEDAVIPATKPRTVQQLRSIEEWDAVIASPTPILVDFAAAWCGPCQAIAPHFRRLAEHATALTLFRLDVDEVPDASQHYSVSALPTFLVFKDGKEVARIQGADEAGLRAALDKAGCPPPKNDIF